MTVKIKKRFAMRDEDLREEFDDWLRPVREAEPPGLPVLKRRLRRRRSRNAVAGVIALGAVAAIAVTVRPVIGGPQRTASPPNAPATAMRAVPAVVTRPVAIQGGYQRSASYTISSPVRTLVVRGYLGNVTVTGSQRSSVSVTEQMRYSTKPPALTRDLAAGTMTLTYTCPSESLCAASYDIQVPRGTAVRATDSAGSIRLSSLSGPVTAITNLGSIVAIGLTSDTANFAADNGQIDATFTAAPGRVYAATAVGAITIHVPATTSYHTSPWNSLGTARVTVPESSSSPHSIVATADAGTVTIAPEE
jgi:hypothetical protein